MNTLSPKGAGGLRADYVAYQSLDLAARGISFASLLIAAHRYDKRELGALILALVLATSCGAITQWGSDRSTFTLLPRQRARAVLWTLFRVRVVVLVLVLPATAGVAHYSHIAGMTWPIALAIGAAAVDAEWWLRWRHRFAVAGALKNVPSLALLGGVLIQVRVPTLVILYALGVFACSAISLASLVCDGDERPDTHVSEGTAEVVTTGLSSLAAPVFLVADQLFLAHVLGVAASAQYSLASRVVTPMIGVLGVIQAVAVPRLHLGAPQLKTYRRANYLALGALLIGSAALLPGLWWLLPQSLRPSVFLAALLMSQLPAIAIGDPYGRYLTTRGHGRGAVAVELGVAITMLAMLAPMILWLGVTGALLTTVLARWLIALGFLLLARHHGLSSA